MTPTSRYMITIELKTPTSFSDAPAMGNNVETLSYIPGSSVRGMFATQYLEKSAPDTLFRHLFVDGAVKFPNMYPAQARRLPLSAYSCKHYPGFQKDESVIFGAPTHLVTDRLWEYFFSTPLETCLVTSCKQPLTPFERTCYTGWGAFKSISPILNTRMSTAVVGRSGSARQGSLHSQQELAARQKFQGYLIASADDYKKIKTALGEGFSGYLGRKRSGLADVSLDKYEKVWEEPNIITHPSHPDYAYGALTCTSDLILIDDLLRPIDTLTTKDLAILANPPSNVEIVNSYAASRIVSGWHSVGKIFKENDLAIAAGSTFLLQFPVQEKESIKTWMQETQMNGLGLRLSEGFGQVTFSEPFHTLSWIKLQRYLVQPQSEDYRL